MLGKQFPDGPPLGKLTPSGGREDSPVPNVGAIPYRGRFAPSPTGPLHAGSLVAALASWLDAQAHGGSWLVRIEDVDAPRCVAGADKTILEQLAACGLLPDEPPTYQSQRGHLYKQALTQLVAQARAYPCTCTRLDIADALVASGHPRQRHDELVYPGTCRANLGSCLTEKPQIWRFLTAKSPLKMAVAQQIRAREATELIANEKVEWVDRRLGYQSQNVEIEVGDFVLQRADGLWAYQLAVVVDDASQGITHVVRGEDLAGNTARQILLQRALGLPAPQYLHTPLVLAADGEKLSKQNSAQAIDTTQPIRLLQAAGQHLGITNKTTDHTNTSDWLYAATEQWRLKMVRASAHP
jgi:glutamyl-Q tRNA(Asp) synthetase